MDCELAALRAEEMEPSEAVLRACETESARLRTHGQEVTEVETYTMAIRAQRSIDAHFPHVRAARRRQKGLP